MKKLEYEKNKKWFENKEIYIINEAMENGSFGKAWYDFHINYADKLKEIKGSRELYDEYAQKLAIYLYNKKVIKIEKIKGE